MNTNDNTTEFIDFVCEAYREYFHIPDELEVKVDVGLFDQGAEVRLYLKVPGLRFCWSDEMVD